MKRFAILFMMAVAFVAAALATTPSAQAGLFGKKAAASPTPSPSPSALPTASPEPPNIAIPRLQAKLKANPNDQQAMVDLAGQFLNINRPDLSIQLTQRLLQNGDKTAQVYYLDGYAQQSLNRLDAAIADLEQAENLDPSNPGVLQQLTTLYLRANRFTDAERIANRAIVLNKGDAESLATLGAVYAAESKYDQARAQFAKAIALDPKSSAPLYQTALTYADQNNIPVALDWVGKVLALNPKDEQALIFKADLYARQHDDAKASAAYDDAIVAAPSDADRDQIIVRKAQYFAGEKKDAQAQSVFTKAIAQYPTSAQLHLSYGDYWASKKDLASAQKEWKAALAIDANNPTALARMGQVSMQQGRMSDAIGYLKKLTSEEPDPQAFAMLGQAYSFTHNYAASKDACAKSFSMEKSPATLGCIAGADFELKNYKEASQIFDVLDRNAKGFLDQNPQLLWVAGKTYASNHEKEKAVGAFKRLLPMIRKGTKEYAEIQNQIAMLRKK
ncbi:MAG TPA: tetratricopeptide repeat protein [Candidatus Aquilonibacter sp.]|nr:tetratricopeptide repeat protein [Candidatus Aquilonibacter sp.]